jgi:hypothetical protein
LSRAIRYHNNSLVNQKGLLFNIEVPTANRGLYFRLPQGARPRPKRKTRGDEAQQMDQSGGHR